jgi:hypothetical protein
MDNVLCMCGNGGSNGANGEEIRIIRMCNLKW